MKNQKNITIGLSERNIRYLAFLSTEAAKSKQKFTTAGFIRDLIDQYQESHVIYISQNPTTGNLESLIDEPDFLIPEDPDESP
jgi:hypothetical protein